MGILTDALKETLAKVGLPGGAAGNPAQSSIPSTFPDDGPRTDRGRRNERVRRDRADNPQIWVPGVGDNGKDKITTIPLANTATSIYRDKEQREDCAARLKKHGIARHGEVKNRKPKIGPSHHFFQNAYLQPNKNRGPGQSRDGSDKTGHVCPNYHEDDGLAIQLKTSDHQVIDAMQRETNKIHCAGSQPLTFEKALKDTFIQTQAIAKIKKMDQKDVACIMLATVAAIAEKCPKVVDCTDNLRIPGC